MKWLIWLLLLFNAMLLGYFQLLQPRPPAEVAGHTPLQPEKLRLLTPRQLAEIPARPVEPVAEAQPAPEPKPLACYEWGSFSSEALSEAQATLGRLGITGLVKQKPTDETVRYWVYIPPLRTPELAQARAEELRTAGVTDFFIIQEARWRNAISLGVFKDEKLATGLLQDLHKRGVRSAVKSVRNHEGAQSSLYLKQVPDEAAAEIDRQKPDFPGSELKQVACEEEQ